MAEFAETISNLLRCCAHRYYSRVADLRRRPQCVFRCFQIRASFVEALIVHKILHLIADDVIKIPPLKCIIMLPHFSAKARISHNGHFPEAVIFSPYVLCVVIVEGVSLPPDSFRDDISLDAQFPIRGINQV